MKQIWVVDDDEEMGRAVGLMLKLLDSEATLFLSARSAVQALLIRKRPHLMIVDINMPEVSGLDLVEFLRRRPEWKDMPLVILSSETSDTMVDKALRYGADSYITKPVTLEELENALMDAFSKHTVSE
ncbi:MAG TPA: response regulator [Anaerolineales bacterium]|nr:response regulator [Anaerolineales bacterium]